MGKSFKENSKNLRKFSHKTSRSSGKKFFKRPKGLGKFLKESLDTDMLVLNTE